VTLLERRDVLISSRPCPWEFACLNGLDDLGDFGIAEQDLGLALDITRVPLIKNVLRQRSLELSLAPEHDD